MKDLYAELGLDAGAGDAEITRACEASSNGKPAAAVLLDPHRRAVYDASRGTLRTIGLLRHRLGMDHGESRFAAEHPDFVPGLARDRPGPQVSGSAPDADDEAATSRNPEPGPAGSRRIANLVIAIVVLVVAGGLFLALR